MNNSFGLGQTFTPLDRIIMCLRSVFTIHKTEEATLSIRQVGRFPPIDQKLLAVQTRSNKNIIDVSTDEYMNGGAKDTTLLTSFTNCDIILRPRKILHLLLIPPSKMPALIFILNTAFNILTCQL